MSGITKALKSALKKAAKSSKFAKIWTPAASGANGLPAFTDDNIRFDRDETRRVLQINAQTEDPTLKKFIKANGTHKKLAVLDVQGQTGTQEEIEAFVEKALEEATKTK